MQKYSRLIICALAVCGWGYGCADNSPFEPDIVCKNNGEVFDPQIDGCRKTCGEGAFFNYKVRECVQCGENEVFDFSAENGKGKCVPKSEGGTCGPKTHLDENGECVPDGITCENEGELYDPQIEECRKKCTDGAFYHYKAKDCIQCGENEVFDFNADNGMGQCIPKSEGCGENQHLDENGECVSDPTCNEGDLFDPQINACREKCEDGIYNYKTGECIVCRESEVFDVNANDGQGQCVPKKVDCGEFQHLDESGNCVDDIICAEGELFNPADGTCIPKPACPLGEYADDTGKCIKVCSCDETLDPSGNCVANSDYVNGDFNELKKQALIETANAFYFRGNNIQNEPARAAYRMTPESATPQKLQFTAFNALPYHFYYQAFGIVLTSSALGFPAYANAYVNDDNHPDVRYFYSDRDGMCDALNTGEAELCKCEVVNADPVLLDYLDKLDLNTCKNDEIYLAADGCRRVIYKGMVDSMQPGDIVVFNNSPSGTANVFMIYKDIPSQIEKQSYTDFIMLRAASNYELKIGTEATYVTKLSRTSTSKGLSWNSKPAVALARQYNGKAPQTVESPFKDVTEGTLQFNTFSSVFTDYIMQNNACKITDFAVLRPAADDKQYYKVYAFSTSRDYYKTVVNDEDGTETIQYQDWKSHVCNASNTSNCVSVEPESYQILPATWCRIKYPSMFIQKTSDIPDGSTVEPGKPITYTIDIRNNNDMNNYGSGEVNYSDLYVQEELSEWVELVESNGGSLYDNQGQRTVAWHIDKIKPGEKKSIQYKVQVKNDPSLLRKTIISSGTVAQIPSGTIQHTISYELSATDVSALRTEFDAAFNVEGGTDILNAIQVAYKNALNIDVPLVDVRLGSIAADKSSPAYTYYQDEARKDFYAENAKALIYTDYGYAKDYNIENVRLNTRHALSKMVYNNYYSAVYTDVTNPTVYIYQKYYDYASIENDIRSLRNVMVYPDTLAEGDILLYVNMNDYVMSGKTRIDLTDDNGMYAFIYLNGKFVGGKTGTVLAEAKPLSDFVVAYHYAAEDTHNDMATRFGDMPKLFGKDFYVILRPALIKK